MSRLSRRHWCQFVGLTVTGATVTFLFRGLRHFQAQSIPRLPSSPNGLELSEFEFDVIMVNSLGQKFKQKTSTAKYFIESLSNNITLEMVAIKSGKFMMGSPEKEGLNTEKPQHQVNISSFFMGKYPITQSQWRVVACFPKIARDLDPEPSKNKGEQNPVERVSWYDAVEFCQRLSRKTGRNYRLPSEAEWEYACRSGTTTPFHFGEMITQDLANFQTRKLTPVNIFPPNAFGLHDLHGNAWEWCADSWHRNYEGAPRDGRVWLEKGNDYVSPMRGGSWYNFPEFCRSAYRNNMEKDRYQHPYTGSFGFRVVLEKNFSFSII